MDNFFASVFSNHLGYNVLVFEVDRTNNNTVLLLHLSESSDLLAIDPIADIIKPFADDGFMGCYFNFVESDTANLVPNGVVDLIGGERILLKVNENPEVSLTKLALKMNGGDIKIKSQLEGRIHTDLKHANPLEMSHQITNLIHVADNWDRLVNGDNNEILLGDMKTSVLDDLDSFVGFDRYYR